MNDEIAIAEQNLALAQQCLEAARQRERAQLLTAAIARGREIKIAYDEAKATFGAAENTYNVARAELGNLGDAIDKHCAAKPALTDFPSAEDVAQWERGLAELTAKRDAAGLKARELDAVLARARQEFVDASATLDYQKQTLVNLQNSGSTKNYV
jgi:hypothetical protein